MVKNIKIAIFFLAGMAGLVFSLALVSAGQYYPIWSRSQGVSAVDVAVFAASSSIFIQCMVGLVVNNFLFLSEGKNWMDFWTGRPFEFFTIRGQGAFEGWRLARGRFLFYMFGVFLTFGLLFLYFAERA
jgi:hypothetical protein